MICIHNKISCSPSTLWLSVFVADRYVCSHHFEPELLELVAVSSLLVASGVHDSDPITSHTCAYQTKGLFTRTEIQEFSKELLCNFSIDTIVTTLQKIDGYLEIISSNPLILGALEKYQISVDLLRSLAYFHAERNLYDPVVAWQKPNLFAISSLKTAIITAFLNQNTTPSTLSSPQSTSIDSSNECLNTSSSQDEYQSDIDFIPLSTSTTCESPVVDVERFEKKKCLQEIIENLTEISGEDAHSIRETAILIAKNVNSDFYLTLHPSSPFDPQLLFGSGKSSQKRNSPGSSPRNIKTERSFSDTQLFTFEQSSKDYNQNLQTLSPTLNLCLPSSRTRSATTGLIYGLKASQSILRDKYSQMRYHRVADIVIPLFD